MKPWISTYIPKTLADIKGQDKGVAQIRLFISQFKTQKKKGMIIHGPPGCGKTAAAHAAGNDLDLEMVEVNASDFRNKEGIETTVGRSVGQMSLFSKGKLILLDEIDGLSGTKDRGGIQAISSLIDKTTFPILMTCNNPWDKKFNQLRKKAVLVEFHPLDLRTVTDILSAIATKEGVGIDPGKIQTLARREGGDLRAAINDLQTISILGSLADIDLLSERNRRDTITDALTKIFKTTDPEIALSAYDTVEEDIDQIFLWIDENIAYEYKLPADLARAYDALSKADVFRGRIRRWQYWRFLVTINQLLSAGIALAKEEKYKGQTTLKPTTRILKIWQANMQHARKKAIAQKIAQATHTSAKQALTTTLPCIQQIFRNNKSQGAVLAEELDLDSDDVAWLRK